MPLELLEDAILQVLIPELHREDRLGGVKHLGMDLADGDPNGAVDPVGEQCELDGSRVSVLGELESLKVVAADDHSLVCAYGAEDLVVGGQDAVAFRPDDTAVGVLAYRADLPVDGAEDLGRLVCIGRVEDLPPDESERNPRLLP